LRNTSAKTLDIILASLGLEIEFKTIRGFGLPTLDELKTKNLTTFNIELT